MTDQAFLLSEAMGYIADEYLEEAHPEISEAPPKKRRRPHIGYYLALAACFCLVAIGVIRLALPSADFLNTSKGEAVAPDADAPIADVIDPTIDDAGVGNTGTRPDNGTTQESTEETTAAESSSPDTKIPDVSEIP